MLLEIIEGSAEDDNVWICLIILFVTPLIQATVGSVLYQFQHTLRLELTGALKSLVYQKAMQLSNDDKSRFDIGKLVNNNQGDVRDSIHMMMLLPRIYTFFIPVATIGLLGGNLGYRSVYSIGWLLMLVSIPVWPISVWYTWHHTLLWFDFDNILYSALHADHYFWYWDNSCYSYYIRVISH